LQVEDLYDAISGENVVAPFNAFLKSHAFQQLGQRRKWNVSICVASKNLIKQLSCIWHVFARGRVTQANVASKLAQLSQRD
jgi:hypothetical protein